MREKKRIRRGAVHIFARFLISMSAVQVIAFRIEWYDTNANVQVVLRLNFFSDNTIELMSFSDRKLFLKRMEYTAISRTDLFIGNTIAILNRVYTIVDYADEGTRAIIEPSEKHMLCVVDRAEITGVSVLFEEAEPRGIVIGRVLVAEPCAMEITGVEINRPSVLIELVSFTSSVNSEVLKSKLQADLPSLRVIQTTPEQVEALLLSAAVPSVSEELTLAMIKPHIFQERNVGQLLHAITDAGFDIAHMQKFHLNGTIAEAFFNVYKGIIHNYGEHILQICAGPVMVLAVQKGHDLESRAEHVVDLFRESCGPFDYEVAKALRPASLRARFAQDRFRNALHCTDVAEDSALECSFFFDVLAAL